MNSICRTVQLFPGPSIDYSDLINDYRKTMLCIFDYLWLDEMNRLNEKSYELIDNIAVLTARDKRKADWTSLFWPGALASIRE